jgi:hypothetical protein
MSGDGMEYGVAVLLDALGTKKNYKRESINDIRGRWNEIDDFFEHSVGTFSEKLHDKGRALQICWLWIRSTLQNSPC